MKQEEATKILDQHEIDHVIPKHLADAAAEGDWDKMREHVVSRLVHEGAKAGAMYPEADQFYAGGSTLKKVEEHAQRLHGFNTPAHHAVHKALLALTSGNVNPKKNFENAHSMMEESKRLTGHPFLGIPERNEPKFRKWMEEHGIEPKQAKEPWKDGVEFFEKHLVDKPAALDDPGYQSHDAVLHKPSGKVIGVERGNKWSYTGRWNAKRILAQPRGTLKYVKIPLVRGKGVEATNWSLRGAQVIKGIRNLKTMLHNGGYEGAAKYLTTKQSPKGIPENYYEKGEPVEGAFIFGPKFGPFSLNLTSPEFGHHLTSDMWHARTMNRYLGQSTGVAGPRNEKERRKWWSMMKEAAGHLGISVASLQSRLWSYEQGLHKALGVKNIDTKTYEDGVNAVENPKHENSRG